MMQKGYVIFDAREKIVVWYLKYHTTMYEGIICEVQIGKNDKMLVCRS